MNDSLLARTRKIHCIIERTEKEKRCQYNNFSIIINLNYTKFLHFVLPCVLSGDIGAYKSTLGYGGVEKSIDPMKVRSFPPSQSKHTPLPCIAPFDSTVS